MTALAQVEPAPAPQESAGSPTKHAITNQQPTGLPPLGPSGLVRPPLLQSQGSQSSLGSNSVGCGPLALQGPAHQRSGSVTSGPGHQPLPFPMPADLQQQRDRDREREEGLELGGEGFTDANDENATTGLGGALGAAAAPVFAPGPLGAAPHGALQPSGGSTSASRPPSPFTRHGGSASRGW